MLDFRSLTEHDFPMLLQWLQKPHVREWWNDGDDTLEKVAAHYGTEPDTERFILMLAEDEGGEFRPVGYFQYYNDEPGIVGIDQFIGEEGLINKGIGTQAVRAFLDLIAEREDPHTIVLDPDPANTRAIRCYEKAGFQQYETVITDEGITAYMMRVVRRPADASKSSKG